MKLSRIHVQTLIDRGALKVLSVENAPKDAQIDPVEFRNDDWLKKTAAMVKADLYGSAITTSFDPKQLKPSEGLLQRLQAGSLPAHQDLHQSREEVIARALADAITLVWPELSNHTKLSVLNVLEIKEDF